MSEIQLYKSTEFEHKIFEKFGIKIIDLTVEKLEKMICDYLDENNVLHLATSLNDVPRSTPLEYRHIGTTIYHFSERGGKFLNLAKNPNVALSLSSPYDPHKDFFGARGLQYWGTAQFFHPQKEPKQFAEILEESGFKAILERVQKELLNGLELPASGGEGIIPKLIKITPKKITLLDLRKGVRNASMVY